MHIACDNSEYDVTPIRYRLKITLVTLVAESCRKEGIQLLQNKLSKNTY